MSADRISAPEALPAGRVRFALATTALMAVVPFLLPMHRYPIQSFYQEWLAFALGAAAFITLGLAARRHRIEAPRVVVFPLGLCLLLAIQVATGKLPYWQQASLGSLYLLWASAIAALGLGLRRHLGWPAFATWLSWALLAGSLATGSLAVAQLAGWGGTGWVMPLATSRLYGNLGQPNHFADYVSLGLVSLVYLVSAGRLPRLPAAAIAVFLLAILDFSGSRAVWIFLAAAVGLGFHLHRRAPGPQSRAALIWISGLAALMIALHLLQLLVWADFGAASESVSVRLLQESTGVSTRLRYAQAAWMMLQSAPLLGVGFQTYGWHHFLLSARLPLQHDLGVADHSHNIVLQLTAEFGLLGAGVALIAGWLWLASQRSASYSLERWWAHALLATLLAHSLLEYPLWYAYFLGVFALLLGASDEVAWRFGAPELDRIAFAGVLILSIAALGSLAFDYRKLERLALPQAFSAAQAGQARADVLALHRGSLFVHWVEFGLSRSIRLEPEELQDKIAVNGRAMRFLPTADMVFRHSALLALAGELEESFRVWDLAVAAYPAESAAAAAWIENTARESQPELKPLVEYAALR